MSLDCHTKYPPLLCPACVVVQSLSHVWLSATPWTAACQASLSIANSRSLLKPTSIELVMPSNHFILCHPLLLLPSTFPSIRVLSNESVLSIRWPKYWSFSFSISSSMNIQDWIPLGLTGLISLQFKGLSKCLLQHQIKKASILQSSDFFMVQLSHPCVTRKNHSSDYMNLFRLSDVFAFLIFCLVWS